MKALFYFFTILMYSSFATNNFYTSMPASYKPHDADFALFVKERKFNSPRYLRAYKDFIILEGMAMDKNYYFDTLRFDENNNAFKHLNIGNNMYYNGAYIKKENDKYLFYYRKNKKIIKGAKYTLANETSSMRWNDMRSNALRQLLFLDLVLYNANDKEKGTNKYNEIINSLAFKNGGLKYQDSLAKVLGIKF